MTSGAEDEISSERISASTKVYDQFIQKETRDTPQLITESDDVEKEDKKELADAIDDPEAEKERLEREVAQLEAEKDEIEKKKERDEVAKKAHQISMMINPDSSDDDAESPPQNDLKIVSSTPDKPKVPFWDFALEHFLVGLGSLSVEASLAHCGSCQKDLELENLRIHLDGDGHKLNTLWNYDRSLAEVTGELRAYPQKFEMEMSKHITVLNRMEKRYAVSPSVESALRELYKDENLSQANKKKEEVKPEIPPEELAEIKAEFIGSIPNEEDAILVQQALMGDLNGFSSASSAVSALRIVTMLGKMICGYQRKKLDTGYKIKEQSVRDVKEQCSHLLKLVDETRLLNR